MRTWHSKLSIRWILPLAMVTPVFAVALALTVLAYRMAEHTANDLAAQSSRQIHERIENHLKHLMDLPPAMNRLNAARLRDGLLALDDPARSRKLVFQSLAIFPEVSSIVLGSAQGQVMWVIRYPGETEYEYAVKTTSAAPMQEYRMDSNGEIGIDPLHAYEFNTQARPWYRAAVEADAPTWGNVYVWVRGGKGVTLGVPYVEPYRDPQGHVLGVINCELTLADISEFLKRLQIGKTGMAFIVERDGNLIATSVGLNCMNDGMGRVRATECTDPRIVTAARRIAAQSNSPADGMNIDHIEAAGQPAQMVSSSFRNRRNLDWQIVTVVPDSDFLADVQRTRTRSMLIGGIAVALALAAGLAVAMWLLNPILAVVAHARRVGGGAVDARIERHDNVEIAQLCSALNEMADGLQDRVRLRHALNLAMEVQQSLLPSATPQVQGLDIAARSEYCDETGGDYYDYLDLQGMGPHSLVIALGDVTGHGIAAAMLMATARGLLRSQVRTQGSLGKLLTHVNEHLVADTCGDRFMTMFLSVIDVASMSMRWASAGHDQPLIYDPESGLLTELDPDGGGLPLGVSAAEEYQELTYRGLRAGQVILVGTDGLWEARKDDGTLFGKARVGDAIAATAHLSAREIDTAIYSRLKDFCGGRSSDDDITYVVTKLT